MNTTTTETSQPLPHPLRPGEFEPAEHPEGGFQLVHGMQIPMIIRRSSYPFAEMRLHDALIFDTERQLKNALQAARTFKKHSPKFKVSGRKIGHGEYRGKYAIIRVQ